MGDFVDPVRVRLDPNQMMLVPSDFVISTLQEGDQGATPGTRRQE